jgi:2TM domain
MQFLVIIAVLSVINYFTSDYPWVLWTILGWGSGLVFHALRVYGKIPFVGAEWEKRQVEKYLGRKI